MLGGTLILAFSGRQLDPGGSYDLLLEESGKTVGRVGVNLAAMR